MLFVYVFLGELSVVHQIQNNIDTQQVNIAEKEKKTNRKSKILCAKSVYNLLYVRSLVCSLISLSILLEHLRRNFWHSRFPIIPTHIDFLLSVSQKVFVRAVINKLSWSKGTISNTSKKKNNPNKFAFVCVCMCLCFSFFLLCVHLRLINVYVFTQDFDRWVFICQLAFLSLSIFFFRPPKFRMIFTLSVMCMFSEQAINRYLCGKQ